MWRFLYLCFERNDGQIRRSRLLLAIHIFQKALRSFLQCVLHLLTSDMLFQYIQRYIASLSFRCRYFCRRGGVRDICICLSSFETSKCFPLQLLKLVRTAEAEADRFREKQQSRGEVRECEERTSACLASYQTRSGVWLLVRVKCVGVAYARCGWKTWLNV